MILVSGFRLLPGPCAELEGLQCVVRTTSVTLVGLQLGRAGVALLVVLLVVHQGPFLAHAKRPVVLGLEAAEFLGEVVPGELVGALRARPLEDDEPAHGGVGPGMARVGRRVDGSTGRRGKTRGYSGGANPRNPQSGSVGAMLNSLQRGKKHGKMSARPSWGLVRMQLRGSSWAIGRAPSFDEH